ncbi:class I adenylate-forming enzyme family protein [Cryptosporangium aurantiacum]|uniref:Acyl-CoA synthetase (AMP-forming)/AMP-acid ligase II n=1 Tax=Cryptosporangium aurantiacum TaxID=134849 RepID=A0A1M7PML3_9ACTN|nr:AMP-binding protein [Cryptosporangium aurantiacum]SHN18484.1 Acyl-CoA synthetase (AMP-forming)/AMP-acid ligase II [Cryptosporangium aurantiacum]
MTDLLYDLVAARAEATPDALLVVDERRRRMTFGQFRDAVERTAAGLVGRGVGAGTVVSWQLPSWIETIVLTFALSRLGAVQNPLIMMLREPEVEFICRQVGADLLIVPPAFRGHDHAVMARNVAARVPGLDVLVTDGALPSGDPELLPAEASGPVNRWAFYTSGTTSAPKGARHTDAGLIAAARVFCQRIAPEPDDRIAALAPLAHVGGVLHVVAALMSGAGLIITDVFEPAATARLLAEEGVTYGGNGTPFVRAFLAEQRTRPDVPLFPRLKCFLIGGAPRPRDLHQQVRGELGGTGIASGFGLTECPFFAWASPLADDATMATTEGPPGPDCAALIVRDDGTRAPTGEAGELRLKGPQLTVGYVDPALDADAFDAEGWFKTGDLAFLDAAGNLTITGRLKDVIIRNMENISAREVEDLLAGCPGLADWTVIGLPDPRTGERVCAVVVGEPGGPLPTLEAVCAYLRSQGLNLRKLPVQLEVVDEVPRNAMGKVAKAALARRFDHFQPAQ